MTGGTVSYEQMKEIAFHLKIEIRLDGACKWIWWDTKSRFAKRIKNVGLFWNILFSFSFWQFEPFFLLPSIGGFHSQCGSGYVLESIMNAALNQMVGSMLANRALTLLHDRGGDCHFE